MISHSIITKPKPVYRGYYQGQVAEPEIKTQQALNALLEHAPPIGSFVVYQSVTDENASLLSVYYVLKITSDLDKVQRDYMNRPKTHLMCNFNQQYLREPELEYIGHFRLLSKERVAVLGLETDDFVQNRIKNCTPED